MPARRKKLSHVEAMEVKDQVLLHLGEQLALAGMALAVEVASDRFLRGTSVSRADFHDVKSQCGGFVKLIQDRPDLFELVSYGDSLDRQFLYAPGAERVHNGDAQPCDTFRKKHYCLTGSNCPFRHDPDDLMRKKREIGQCLRKQNRSGGPSCFEDAVFNAGFVDQDDHQHVHPSEVYFSHGSISNYFRNGRGLDDVIGSVLENRMQPPVFPPLEVAMHDGKLFAVTGNRRLFVSRVLAAHGKISHVAVTFLPKTSSSFARERWDARFGRAADKWERSYSTSNGGVSVRVSSKYAPEQCTSSRTSVSASDTPRGLRERSDPAREPKYACLDCDALFPSWGACLEHYTRVCKCQQAESVSWPPGLTRRQASRGRAMALCRHLKPQVPTA